MTEESKIYPNLPSAPQSANYKELFHLNTVRTYLDELASIKKKYEAKCKKFNKIYTRLTNIATTSNGLGVLTGTGAVASSATVVGVPVGASLGGVAVALEITNGVLTIFSKKYQKKILNNMKVLDMLSSSIASIELLISQYLHDRTLIDSREFDQSAKNISRYDE